MEIARFGFFAWIRRVKISQIAFRAARADANPQNNSFINKISIIFRKIYPAGPSEIMHTFHVSIKFHSHPSALRNFESHPGVAKPPGADDCNVFDCAPLLVALGAELRVLITYHLVLGGF